jgi:hypothetical protein
MKMTNEQARDIFNQAIASTTNADQIARLEVVREFLTNPEFRKNLSDFVWSTLNG